MGNWTYLYGSYQFDPASALYQVRNRYYHAALGRWLSRDPYVDAQGNDAEFTQGANLYWYVSNNAVNNVDPIGLLFFTYPVFCPLWFVFQCEESCIGDCGFALPICTATAHWENGKVWKDYLYWCDCFGLRS
jgi:RHS repeat-associated protein